MSFEITRVDVWAGELEDRPGALSTPLAHIMMSAGANLEFIVGRPSHETPGHSVLFVAPLTTDEQRQAAADVNMRKSDAMHVLRLSGPDRPGLTAGVAGMLAQASINIVGISAAAIGGNALVYVRFASADDAAAAEKVLAEVLV
ncbi:MAG: ACT domain-containing protein [Phycisphaerae bacterium]|nr:ACT domain-containing protein [Phycisphaerae bacterium]